VVATVVRPQHLAVLVDVAAVGVARAAHFSNVLASCRSRADPTAAACLKHDFEPTQSAQQRRSSRRPQCAVARLEPTARRWSTGGPRGIHAGGSDDGRSAQHRCVPRHVYFDLMGSRRCGSGCCGGSHRCLRPQNAEIQAHGSTPSPRRPAADAVERHASRGIHAGCRPSEDGTDHRIQAQGSGAATDPTAAPPSPPPIGTARRCPARLHNTA